MVVLSLGASLTLATQTGASSTHPSQRVEMTQSGPGPSAPGLCFATQRCVPANHPSCAGSVSPVLMAGFIGTAAVVLAGLRRRRRGPVHRPTPFRFFPGIFRPPTRELVVSVRGPGPIAQSAARAGQSIRLPAHNSRDMPERRVPFRKVSIMSHSSQAIPSRRPAARLHPTLLRPTLLAWGAVVLVAVIVATLVIVKISTGDGATTSSRQAVLPASSALVHELSTVPASVFDTVGVGIPSEFAGDAPIVISGQPPLSLDGTSPAIMYYGAEYCPFCAAERWGLAVALARFGTWTGLDTTASGLLDGDFSTLSFRDAKLTSRYINFVPVETCTNVVDPGATGCSGYKPLQNPTAAERAVLAKYASSTFVPDDTQGISFPYIDVDNRVLYSGSTYEPTVLTGLTQAQIAGGLTDPTNPVTRSIIGTANYLTASICASLKDAPAAVCASPGVRAAAAALKLTLPVTEPWRDPAPSCSRTRTRTRLDRAPDRCLRSSTDGHTETEQGPAGGDGRRPRVRPPLVRSVADRIVGVGFARLRLGRLHADERRGVGTGRDHAPVGPPADLARPDSHLGRRLHVPLAIPSTCRRRDRPVTIDGTLTRVEGNHCSIIGGHLASSFP